MEFKKPEYPKALEAYKVTSVGHIPFKRMVVKNKTEEDSFINRHHNKFAIREVKLTKDELENFSITERIVYKTPTWAWIAITLLSAIVLAYVTELLKTC